MIYPNHLLNTPLILNPVEVAAGPAVITGDPSSEYFIGVKSIKVDNKRISFNASLLSINKVREEPR